MPKETINALLQLPGTDATRAITKVFNITDWVGHIEHSAIDNIGTNHKKNDGQLLMPVGNVDFVRKAMIYLGIAEPEPLTYAEKIEDLLFREVKLITKGEMNKLLADSQKKLFVKPYRAKLFNGFVIDAANQDDYDNHDEEQYSAFLALPDTELVWVSDIVNFIAEWRIYLTEGDISAVCRYDANDSEIEPDQNFVNECASRFDGETLAIDIGTDDRGKFYIVELNDAWAIGKYKGISEKDYFLFLEARWRELAEK